MIIFIPIQFTIYKGVQEQSNYVLTYILYVFVCFFHHIILHILVPVLVTNTVKQFKGSK